MKSLLKQLLLTMLLISSNVFSSTGVVVFLIDGAAVRGVQVLLDDATVGVTDSAGMVQFDISAGEHQLVLQDDGQEIPISFSLSETEDVEIAIFFDGNEDQDPQVAISKFAPDELGELGFFVGTVLDSSGAAIANALVSLQDGVAEFDTQTGNDGIFTLELPRGLYSLSISAEGYATSTSSDVRIVSGLGVNNSITLTGITDTERSASGALEEVIVMGTFRPSDNSVGIERYATSITNVLDAEQLERFGDSDVASALGRIAGVSVVDSKYATVRGLDGRYISSSLNTFSLPSTDPMRRDVQLDLFPTNIVGSIQIQKTFTPDQSATTTGGSVKILTKGLPDERVIKIGASAGYNFETTGSDVVTYHGSNTDWGGFDSGLRSLPSAILAATDFGRSLTICDPNLDPICTAPIDAARMGVLFQDDWNIKTKDGVPPGGLSFALGDRFGPESNWGIYVAGNYGFTTNDRATATVTNPFENTGTYRRTRETIDLNGYVVVGYEYGAANEILSKTSILRSTDDTTRQEVATDKEEVEINQVLLEYVERQLVSQSFTGHNEFDLSGETHTLDWRLAYSRTDRDEPDRRQYQYRSGSLSTTSVERRFSDLEEDSVDIGFDYVAPFAWGSGNYTEVQLGALYSDKDRDVQLYRFGIRLGDLRDTSLSIDEDLESILSYGNFALDRIRLATSTTNTDSYNSAEETTAYYINTNTEIGDSWILGLGARYEDFTQDLSYPNQESSGNTLENDDWYPAASLVWKPTDEIQLRLGYSETVSYPGLIERSQSLSYDPTTDDPIFGNPNLVASAIENFDARLEYYFSDAESISLALFLKEIADPIERALPDASGSAAAGITFRNQTSADLQGIEIDFTKNVAESDSWTVFVSGNLSYIDSEVELSANSLRLEGEAANGRPLQGQSEWLGNVQFGFDHYPSNQKLTVLINYFDDRIFRVARGAATGSEIEVERFLLDITYSKEFQMFGDLFTIELGIKNLLDEDIEYSQNNRIIESYQTGTSFGITLNYEFL